MPRTSSFSIAASSARPASSGVAAPPEALSPVSWLIANTPAPTIATAPTAAAMTLPFERPGAGARPSGLASASSAGRTAGRPNGPPAVAVVPRSGWGGCQVPPLLTLDSSVLP